MEQARNFLSSCIRGGDVRRKRPVCLLPMPLCPVRSPEFTCRSLSGLGLRRGRNLSCTKRLYFCELV